MTEFGHALAKPADEVFRPQPDGTIDPAGEAGWFLQRERERRSLSLPDVAAETGIHESHLGGIEHGDLTKLPSRIEALKMVGIYGQYLGFDPEPLIVHYTEFLPSPISPAQTNGGRTPPPLSSATIISFTHALRRAPLQRVGRTIGSCLAVVVTFSAAVWFLVPGTPGGEVAAAIDPLPTASMAPEAGLATPPAPEGNVPINETPLTDDQIQLSAATADAASGAEPELEQAPEQRSLAELITRTIADGDAQGSAAHEEGTKKSGLGAEEVAEGSKEASPGRVVGEANTAARIVLRATGAVLIRIEDSLGNVVVSHSLAAGDRYQVPSRDDLVVVAGDGGLVNVEIDGVRRGTLGMPGEIVVGRPLRISTLLAGQG